MYNDPNELSLEQAQVINLDWPYTVLKMMADESYVRVILGPYGSAKTWGSLYDLFERLPRQHPEKRADGRSYRFSRGAILRQTYKELTDTTIHTFRNGKIIPTNCSTFKMSPYPVAHVCFQIEDGTFVESEILFLCCDKPDDLRKFRSMELHWAYFNELCLFELNHVTEVLSRLGRGVDKRYIGWIGAIADSNFCEEGHWLHRFCEEETPEGWRFFKQAGAILEGEDGRWRPNPLAENIENLHGGYDYYFRNLPAMLMQSEEKVRVIYGAKWGSVVHGKPVFEKSFNRKIHVRDEIACDHRLGLLVGFDLGNDPSAILCQWNGGQLRVLDEVIGVNIGVHDFLVNFFKPFLAEHYHGYRVLCIADATGGNRSKGKSENEFDDFAKPDTNLKVRPTTSMDPTVLHEAGRWALLGGNAIKPRCIIARHCTMLLRGLSAKYHFRKLQVSGHARYSESVEKNEWSHPVEAWLHLCAWLKRGEQIEAFDPHDNVVPFPEAPMTLDSVTGY